MNKEDIIKKFKQVDHNSSYIAVSDDHPLNLFLGKNEEGYLTLRFNSDFIPIKITSNDILTVKQYKLKNYNSILFSYNSEEEPTLFYSFCEDIINNTYNCDIEKGYSVLVNRYNQWKKMFYHSPRALSEQEIMGLIGELSFLENYIFGKYGQTEGIRGWTGPEPTKKDYSYNETWFEIKAISSFRNVVEISSLEQLDSEFDGTLVIYKLQKMSPNFSGISLNSLVEKIFKTLIYDSDKELFSDKLKQAGYAYNDYYDDFVYEVESVSYYTVNDTFPRIKKESVPKGIGKIKYEILIDYLDDFKETL